MPGFTNEQLAALQEAFASGVRTVTHGANSVTYNSMDEMARAIAHIERQLAGRSKVSYPTFTRGTRE